MTVLNPPQGSPFHFGLFILTGGVKFWGAHAWLNLSFFCETSWVATYHPLYSAPGGAHWCLTVHARSHGPKAEWEQPWSTLERGNLRTLHQKRFPATYHPCSTYPVRLRTNCVQRAFGDNTPLLVLALVLLSSHHTNKKSGGFRQGGPVQRGRRRCFGSLRWCFGGVGQLVMVEAVKAK